MVLGMSPIQLDLLHPSRLGCLGDRLANKLSSLGVPAILHLITQTLVPRAGRRQRLPGRVIDDLAADMLQRSLNA